MVKAVMQRSWRKHRSQCRRQWLHTEIHLENIQMDVLEPLSANGMDPALGLCPPDVRTMLLSACWGDAQLAHGGFRVVLLPSWSTGLHGTAQVATAVAAMHQALCIRVFLAHHMVSLKPHASFEVRAIIIPIAQMSKLRIRKLK